MSLNIKILRGHHDMNMVDDILRLTHDSNVLFLEMMAPADHKAKVTDLMNRITMADSFKPELYDAATIEAQPDAYLRLIWQLRGQNVLIVLVDKVLAETDNPSLDDYYALDKPTLDQLAKTNDFDDYYAALEKRANYCAGLVRERDELVAKQVSSKIQELQQEYPGVEFHPALVQGKSHRSQPYLEKSLPDATFEEHFYNPQAGTVVDRLPCTIILDQKVAAPDWQIPVTLADKAVCFEITDFLYDKQHGVNDDTNFPDTKSIDISQDPSTAAMLQCLNELDRLSDEQLHQKALNDLEKLRQAQ